jgi:Outer membrane lipoprotein carrier protein LolA-like
LSTRGVALELPSWPGLLLAAAALATTSLTSSPTAAAAAQPTVAAEVPALGAPAESENASEPQAYAELLRLLAARRHGRVAFREVHEMSMLERALQSSGELVYDAPDHLEKRTLEPRAETLTLEHGVLTARRGHHSHVLALRDYPQVVPYVESIRATLAGDRAALERYFRVRFSGDLEHWRLQLVPADPTLARTVRDIRIEGERDAIGTVEIRQTDGDRSVLTIGPEIPR